jgi:hypothetical protein
VIRIVSQRQIGETIEVQTRYFISSLPADAKRILKAKRSALLGNFLHQISGRSTLSI